MLLDVGGVNANEAELLIRACSTHGCTVGVVRPITRSAVVVTPRYFVVAVCVAVMVVVPATSLGVTIPPGLETVAFDASELS